MYYGDTAGDGPVDAASAPDAGNPDSGMGGGCCEAGGGDGGTAVVLGAAIVAMVRVFRSHGEPTG